MSQPRSTLPIVVGIDGSEAAVNAAKWAAVEAGNRELPLRLVHVIDGNPPRASDMGPDLGVEYAETVLREADAVLHTVMPPTKVETVIVRGSPESRLVDESDHAAMVCVGSIGLGRFSRMLFGSTATALVRGAHCPVAVIRAQHGAVSATGGWVAVGVDDEPDNDMVLEHAFREAQLRGAPLLALETQPWQRVSLLDQRVESWSTRYPDVRVRLTLMRRGLTEFLASTDEPIQLAVIGDSDVDGLARIVGPISHDVAGQAGCSVLVVRD